MASAFLSFSPFRIQCLNRHRDGPSCVYRNLTPFGTCGSIPYIYIAIVCENVAWDADSNYSPYCSWTWENILGIQVLDFAPVQHQALLRRHQAVLWIQASKALPSYSFGEIQRIAKEKKCHNNQLNSLKINSLRAVEHIAINLI